MRQTPTKSDRIPGAITSLPRARVRPVYAAYNAFAEKLKLIRNRYYEVSGHVFDLWHGVDTERSVENADLNIPDEHRSHARKYQPTKLEVFSHLLRRIPLKDLGQVAFVDLGCGKGRCLLLAARAGFGAVIGVELSTRLCETARRNADHFETGSQAAKIEVQCAEASEAKLPDLPGVYFFYNPFDEHSMSASVATIAAHLDATGEEGYIVYVNPLHRAAISGHGFRLIESGTRRGEDWAIFHHPAPVGKATKANA